MGSSPLIRAAFPSAARIRWASSASGVATGARSTAQFIIICRWLQLIHKDRPAPLENAPFSTQWARKRCRVGQRFRQYLRATNCYKLSDIYSHEELQRLLDATALLASTRFPLQPLTYRT